MLCVHYRDASRDDGAEAWAGNWSIVQDFLAVMKKLLLGLKEGFILLYRLCDLQPHPESVLYWFSSVCLLRALSIGSLSPHYTTTLIQAICQPKDQTTTNTNAFHH